MKRISAIVLVVLAAFAAGGSLQAQENNTVRANIPFNFIVGSKQLPAGRYSLFTQRDHLVVIRNETVPVGVLTITSTVNVPEPGQHNLLFHKYGDRYFLSEIRCSSSLVNGELPFSKMEKQAQHQHLEASIQPETVQVALGN